MCDLIYLWINSWFWKVIVSQCGRNKWTNTSLHLMIQYTSWLCVHARVLEPRLTTSNDNWYEILTHNMWCSVLPHYIMSDDHGYVGNYPEHVFFNTALTFAQFVWEETNFPFFFNFSYLARWNWGILIFALRCLKWT